MKVRRFRLGITALLTVLFAFVSLAAAAHASIVPASPGEPTYTKGTSNTWWFNYQQPSGATGYYVVFKLNGVVVDSTQGTSLAPSGQIWDNQTNLQSGTYYNMTATEYYYSQGFLLPGASAFSHTTMDTSIPDAYTAVDGTATYTSDPVMDLQIAYADSISPPWPAGSTFDCWRKNANNPGTPCQNAPSYQPTTFQFDPGCSTNSWDTSLKSFSWDCTYDLRQLPGFSDGTWYYCAQVVDWAIPDNPNSSNQFVATSDKANRSSGAPQTCGSIVLDRAPPTVTPHGPAQVQVGDLTSFSVSATDPLSGASGQYAWTFGDNTGTASGASPSHTYMQPGTYQVSVTTHDGAGNEGTGQLTIVVKPRITPPTNQTLPRITGVPRHGQTLTSTTGSWSQSPTSFSYQWQVCNQVGNACSDIQAATARTHLLTGTDVGHTIRIRVTAHNGAGSASARSAPTTVVAPPAPSITSARLAASTFKASLGTTLRLTLSQPGTVRVRVLKSGVMVAQKSFTGHAGANAFRILFPKLNPGPYKLSITARNAAGLTSKAITLPLVITR